MVVISEALKHSIILHILLLIWW